MYMKMESPEKCLKVKGPLTLEITEAMLNEILSVWASELMQQEIKVTAVKMGIGGMSLPIQIKAVAPAPESSQGSEQADSQGG